MKFKIYYSASGFGLVKDARILGDALTSLGFDVSVVEVFNKKNSFSSKIYGAFEKLFRKLGLIFFFRKLQRAILGRPQHVSVHLEAICYSRLFAHDLHVLIPNQEWFSPGQFDLLSYVDRIWAKTDFALQLFSEFRRGVEYIGFCSEVDPGVGVDPCGRYFFSRIGISRFRGAERLVEAWRQHPEWPLLKMVIDPSCRPVNPPANVQYLDFFSTTEEYVACATSALFHIYATETEGFGHSIVESMGYGALVLVTDAPPMNEVANKDCALLIAASYSGQKWFSPRFLVDLAALEAVVERALTLDHATLEQVVANARAQPGLLKDNFYQHLSLAINKL